jgi:hypothetical protein
MQYIEIIFFDGTNRIRKQDQKSDVVSKTKFYKNHSIAVYTCNVLSTQWLLVSWNTFL